MAYKLIWSPAARDDLHDITIFIAHDDSDHAMSFGYRLISETDRLRDFPESGRIVPEYRMRSFAKSSFRHGIQKPLGFELRIIPIAASTMDQECGRLCDCNPESFACLEVTNFSFKLELIILRLNDRCYEVWMWNVVVVIFVRPASIPLGLGEDMRARACRMPETNSIFTGPKLIC
jgi:plasmid stabilization system protein ParE